MIKQALIFHDKSPVGVVQVAQYQINFNQALIVVPDAIQTSQLTIKGEGEGEFRCWYLGRYQNLNWVVYSILKIKLGEDSWDFGQSPDPLVYCGEQLDANDSYLKDFYGTYINGTRY